jgi:DNA-binding transcriptional LysR family regulator
MRVQHYMVAPLIAMRTDLALTGPLRLLHRTQGRIIGLPFEVPPLEWHCYWHRSAEQDQANRWLRQELVRLVEDVVT